MFVFTKQEQLTLVAFSAIVLVGSVLHYALKKYPGLHHFVNIIDSERIYTKVDVNTATPDELVALPYIGEYTAANIVRYRNEHGPFQSLAQLKHVKGIRDKNYSRFLPYLKKIIP